MAQTRVSQNRAESRPKIGENRPKIGQKTPKIGENWQKLHSLEGHTLARNVPTLTYEKQSWSEVL